MPNLNIPDDVLNAAAEQANLESRSLADVIVTLLRDYAAGRTWLSEPLPGVQIGNHNVQTNVF